MDRMNDSINDILRLLAKRKKLTQEKIAKELMISRISVNRFLCGKSQLRASEFVKICLILGIDIKKSVDNELVNSEKIF